MIDYINSTIFLYQVLLTMLKNTLLVVVRTLFNLVAVEASYLQPIILDEICH